MSQKYYSYYSYHSYRYYSRKEDHYNQIYDDYFNSGKNYKKEQKNA